MIDYLARNFFMESMAVILLLMTVCSVMLKRIKGRQAVRMILFAILILLLVFLFSFVSVRDGYVKDEETVCYDENTSDTWTYIIVDY